MPFLSRLTQGSKWLLQYLGSEGELRELIGKIVFIEIFGMIPALVILFTALISKPPYYLPTTLSAIVALFFLADWHHDNDLSADAQAAISLIIIPVQAAALALAASLLGLALQAITLRLKSPD